MIRRASTRRAPTSGQIAQPSRSSARHQQATAADNDVRTGSRLSKHRVKDVLPFLVVAYMAIAGIIWAALTPPGGIPDEPSHIIYAAGVVRGDTGTVVAVDHPPFDHLVSIDVPAWVSSIQVCYAFNPAVTADCQPPLIEDDSLSPALTTATKYPPAYYAVVGLPSLFLTGARGMYAMRGASVLLAVSIVGLGLGISSPGRRWWLSAGALVAFTPMVAYLVGSVNPNGAEIAATMSLAIAMLGLTDEGGSNARAWFQTLGIGLLGAYLVWARPWSTLNLAAVLGVVLLANRRSLLAWIRRNRIPGIVSGLLITLSGSGAIVFEVAVRDPAEKAVAASSAAVTAPLAQNIDATLQSWASWITDNIGRLGWLDHTAPSLIQFIWLAFVAALLIWALAMSRPSQRIVLMSTVVGSTLLAPLFVLQFLFGSVTGYQARYHLPLVVLVPVLTLFLLGANSTAAQRDPSKAVLGWFGALAPIMMVTTAAWSVARYALGQPFGWPDIVTLRFLLDGVWTPPQNALTVAIVGVVGLIVSAPVLWMFGRATPGVHFEPVHPQLDSSKWPLQQS